MYISVIFPLADFRVLHDNHAGRLSKPKWGEHDPQALFVRGFGSIHTRNKSGLGFFGENYYADCDNLVKYPQQTFVSAIVGDERRILTYPIYRRFYFDGLTSGRFELGFRMNKATLEAAKTIADYRHNELVYDPVSVAKQILSKQTTLHLLDGRTLASALVQIMEPLRDAYLMATTSSSAMHQYDITSVGSRYVNVSSPFVVVRSGSDTPLTGASSMRSLYKGEFAMWGARSGHHRRDIDTMIIESSNLLTNESAKERFARLFYTQIRCLSFSHSFYLRQSDKGQFTGPSHLRPAVAAMLTRLQNLQPVAGDKHDADVCLAMAEIVANSDFNPSRLADEINKRVSRTWARRFLPAAFNFVDKKIDKAIEAAASTATKQALNGGL
ncbi:hypothetical protein [Devosia sp. 1566]|uniref:hypothetical protein n=1 Tax=Devosia sp. 1566 TaxID=2499144 RepID=UPI000FD8F766|nr:hypothetical protein [Devosia sp. 1566]